MLSSLIKTSNIHQIQLLNHTITSNICFSLMLTVKELIIYTFCESWSRIMTITLSMTVLWSVFLTVLWSVFLTNSHKMYKLLMIWLSKSVKNIWFEVIIWFSNCFSLIFEVLIKEDSFFWYFNWKFKHIVHHMSKIMSITTLMVIILDQYS
jgi:hypothetical protein